MFVCIERERERKRKRKRKRKRERKREGGGGEGGEEGVFVKKTDVKYDQAVSRTCLLCADVVLKTSDEKKDDTDEEGAKATPPVKSSPFSQASSLTFNVETSSSGHAFGVMAMNEEGAQNGVASEPK